MKPPCSRERVRRGATEQLQTEQLHSHQAPQRPTEGLGVLLLRPGRPPPAARAPASVGRAADGEGSFLPTGGVTPPRAPVETKPGLRLPPTPLPSSEDRSRPSGVRRAPGGTQASTSTGSNRAPTPARQSSARKMQLLHRFQ